LIFVGERAEAALWETLKKAREAARLSQESLAARINQTQSYISEVEAGKRASFRVIDLCNWAEGCELDPMVLFAMFWGRVHQRVHM
jgi:transcriptional regulator with XRE-family HTH domain